MNDAQILKNPFGVSLALTKPTGKIRVKERKTIFEYGEPVATRSRAISQFAYVEWQIGYDILNTSENAKTLSINFPFKNYKNENKLAYELSEIIFETEKKGLLKKEEIKKVYKILSEFYAENFLDQMQKMQIQRTPKKQVQINGINFHFMSAAYPLVLHEHKSGLFAEIIIKEKQRAVGIQPMLFVCVPIEKLIFEKPAVGRALIQNERAVLKIDTSEANFLSRL